MLDQKTDFKSCPFCGADTHMNEGARLKLSPTRNGLFAVACLCGAAGPEKDSEEKAIKGWNTRVYSGRDFAQSPFSF